VLADEQATNVPDDVVLHVGDVCDVEATRHLMLDLGPDEIYNLAAISSVAQSWEWPDLTALVNGTAAVALLESAYQLQSRAKRDVRFVQASSAEIFGQPAASPQDEATPVHPLNPYGAAKAYAHLMVDVYRTRGLHASSLVLYNHESPRRPKQFVTRKISSTVAAIVQGRKQQLMLGNLDARRDWGWAPDYVEAMSKAAAAAEPSDYVVATGHSRSVRDFVGAAFSHVGITDWDDLVIADPSYMRPADATDLVGDASRARANLGWTPSITFTDLVGRMVDADLAGVPS
jgi:GDPmannose 4,6-dehydratase